jgi:hypothetical protein
VTVELNEIPGKIGLSVGFQMPGSGFCDARDSHLIPTVLRSPLPWQDRAGEPDRSWVTYYIPHCCFWPRLATFHWNGEVTKHIVDFLSRHRTITEPRLQRKMFYHQPEEGLESLLPDIRKLSIEANDLPRLVPGREVHTLNVWRLGSISNFSLTHNSVSGTARTLVGRLKSLRSC